MNMKRIGPGRAKGIIAPSIPSYLFDLQLHQQSQLRVDASKIDVQNLPQASSENLTSPSQNNSGER